MCLTSTLTPVLPLRSLSVITLPIAAGFTPVLVNRSSRPHAAPVSKKMRTTNRAMRGFMLYLPTLNCLFRMRDYKRDVVAFFLIPSVARDHYDHEPFKTQRAPLLNRGARGYRGSSPALRD